MTLRVNLIERHSAPSPSIERVFRTVAKNLTELGIEPAFQKLPFGDGVINVIKNLLRFRAESADIFHVTGHVTFIVLALPAKRTVVTIHDLTILKTAKGLRRFALKKLYYEWPVRRAAVVTAISENTARELSEELKIGMERIRIIDDPLSIETEDTERRFSTPPRILQIGTSPNKNVPTLVKALSEIECTLHLVGPMTEVVREALRANKVDYKHDENLSENEILNAYRSADIVTFCSTSEGFGLPIIEAQALGIPVVTSNISPMNTVAGSGALLVDPFDVLSIREGIRRIIAEEGLRDRLRAEGKQNVLRFSPMKIAQEYLDVYREIAKDRSLTVREGSKGQ